MSVTHVARTPGLIHGKQVDQKFLADFQLRGVTLGALGGSVDVTAGIATWAATGARNGTSVPMQLSANIDVEGVVVSANLLVQINENPSGLVPKDATDNDKEIFGRVSEAAGVYTVTFYKLDALGVDEAIDLPAANYDFILFYCFPLHKVPANALIGLGRKDVSQDPVTAGVPKIERVAVTALNVIAPITFLPKAGSVRVEVNGVSYAEVTHSGITVTGQAIAWAPLLMLFDLETSDTVDVYAYQ